MAPERVTSSQVRNLVLLCFGNHVNAHNILAIRFVLSDAYTSMTREERQSLLHEGVSTAQTLSAFGTLLADSMYLLACVDLYTQSRLSSTTQITVSRREEMR